MSKPTGYTVVAPPKDPNTTHIWAYQELRKVSLLLNELVERSSASYQTPPDNPREGLVVYAKAPWDPGGGNGFYGWDGTSWTKLS